MPMLIRDPGTSKKLIARRKALGVDGHDEVWDGVYVMPPMANDEHQQVIARVTAILQDVIGWSGLGEVRPGVNITDLDKHWKKNYRVPDVAVFLRGCKAINRNTHWLGGPDWLAEIVSPGDESRQKLPFYAKVGVREILLIDRDPWGIELYQLRNEEMVLVGQSTLDQPDELKSGVLPLTFRLVQGLARPVVQVTLTDGSKLWHV